MVCRLMLNLKRVPAVKMDTDLIRRFNDDTLGTTLNFDEGRFTSLNGIEAFGREVDISASGSTTWMEEVDEHQTFMSDPVR